MTVNLDVKKSKQQIRVKLLFTVSIVASVILGAFVLPKFLVFILTEMMILGLFGMSVNMLVGYCGMVTFGHAAFYGVGAYTLALLLIKTGLPFFASFLLAPIVASGLGVMIGFFCIRLTRFYFAMLTLAFGMLIWAVIYKWESFTGGDNGIVGVVVPAAISSPTAFALFTLSVLLASCVLLRIIINSPFGSTMKAIRENPERVIFLGVNLTVHRLVTFTVSAFFAGLSGALYSAFTRGAFPSFAHWSMSGEGLVMCLIGGLGIFFGPLVGAGVFIFLQQGVTSIFKYWSFALGVILVVLVLFLPGGILGSKSRFKIFSTKR